MKAKLLQLLFFVVTLLSFPGLLIAQKKRRGAEVSVANIQDLQNQKKPTLVILPSDNWCAMRYFMTTWDNQGSKVKVPNYAQAFQEDTELSQVISKVGGLLTAQGYSIKDAEQELRTMAQRQSEDNVTMGKNSGAFLAESPLDQLKKRAKADILIQIWWKVNKEPNGKSVSFTLEAFDCYTSKRIGSSTGTGPCSTEIVPVLLEEAVKSRVSEFDSQMISFYQDINKNGREIVVNIKRWADWDNDLESEFDGKVLADIIEDWFHENAKGGKFNLTDASENMMSFEQVRIPLTNESGRTIDARGFLLGLQRHLKSKYNIPAKLMTRGLGEAMLVLGEQ